MGVRPAILMMVVVLWAATAFSQGTSPQESNSSQVCSKDKPNCAATTRNNNENVPNAPAAQNENQQNSLGSKRLMYVAPDFEAVSPNQHPPPLSTRGKFRLAMDNSFDYSAFTWAAILAAQTYGLNSDPELGRGGAAYLRYYWRIFTDGVSSSYFTQAVVPTIYA